MRPLSDSGTGLEPAQATNSAPTIASPPNVSAEDSATRATAKVLIMLLIFLEALGALLLLILIVWWTMFSGRNKGELPPPSDESDKPGNRR